MNALAHLKIGQRLYLGFAAVLVLLTGITALAWNGLNTSHNATERIVMMKERAANTEEWLLSTQLNINRVLAVAKSGNNPAVDSYFKPMIANTTARINEVQKVLEAAITSERGKALLAEIADKRSAYIAVRKSYFDALKAGDAAGADQLLNTGLMPAADAYSGKQRDLLDFQTGLVTKAIEASESTVKSQIALLIGLAAAAIALAMVMAWRITRSVTQPLAEALAMSRDVAGGNLTRQIKTSRADELGDLLRALAEMQSSLVHTVTQVRSTTDSINIASAEIASGNQDLSARTEQAASNLEETAASMEQLTSTVRQSADSARQANQLAASASEIAVRGGNVVGQVVTTMNEINASSKKISDIIGVIDGIAFQTNILALNAAVEAARAGEQGRGFAVVAAEVRSLAQRSAEAAKEIKGLIGSSVDRVEAGSRLVAEAGQTMSEIVGSVQRVSDIIGEITAASGEQSDGISQVNVAVNQLDQMTQQNAALVEESAAAAESLKDQATRLAQVVQIFRIDGLVSHALPAPSAPELKAQPRKALVPARPLNAAARPSATALPRTAPVKKALAPTRPALGKPTATAGSGDEGDWESF
jgi:methyl-accepting chemotaxis protein